MKKSNIVLLILLGIILAVALSAVVVFGGKFKDLIEQQQGQTARIPAISLEVAVF